MTWEYMSRTYVPKRLGRLRVPPPALGFDARYYDYDKGQ
jgi:hypothetical protein